MLDIIYKNNFILENESLILFDKIKDDCFSIKNQKLITNNKMPRLIKWYGEKPYSYSNVWHESDSMPNYLNLLMNQINVFLNLNEIDSQMNSVLINYYRDGSDMINYHSDNEDQIGSKPVIVSLSLGDSRVFKFRNKESREIITYELKNSDLIIMKGNTQDLWQHGILKEANKKERINLTFRNTKYLPKERKEND